MSTGSRLGVASLRTDAYIAHASRSSTLGGETRGRQARSGENRRGDDTLFTFDLRIRAFFERARDGDFRGAAIIVATHVGDDRGPIAEGRHREDHDDPVARRRVLAR